MEKVKIDRGYKPVSYTPNEDNEDRIDISKIYTELVNSINVMLNLADEDYIHPDDIKIVMLATY